MQIIANAKRTASNKSASIIITRTWNGEQQFVVYFRNYVNPVEIWMEKTFKPTINCRLFIVYSVRLIMNHDTNSTGAHFSIRKNGIGDPQRSKNERNWEKKMEMLIFPMKFIQIKWNYVNHLMKLFHPSNISCIWHTNYHVESKNHSNWWKNEWCKCRGIIFLKPIPFGKKL